MKKLIKLLLPVLLLSCSNPADTEEIEAFIPPNDSLFSTVKDKSELKGNWGIFCTKSRVKSITSPEYSPSYKSASGTGDDYILRNFLLLAIDDYKLDAYLWSSVNNKYEEADFWITDSNSISLTSEEYGTTQLSVALALNQYTSDITLSSDTLRIRLRAVDIISTFAIIVHIEYIDYYYVKTSKSIDSILN